MGALDGRAGGWMPLVGRANQQRSRNQAQLAHSPLRSSNTPHQTPPAGSLAGLACCGALVPVIGGAVRRVGALAALICATGPWIALGLVMVGPAAYSGSGGGGSSFGSSSNGGGTPAPALSTAAAEAAASAFFSGSEKLLALSCGWSVYTGAALLLPQARSWNARRAAGGAALGAVLAAVGAVASAAICAVTPGYCISVAPASRSVH